MQLTDAEINALKIRAERGTVSRTDMINLVDTIDDLRHRKKQWQRLATRRGSQLRDISRLAHMQEEDYG